jgi:hypothetical protein
MARIFEARLFIFTEPLYISDTRLNVKYEQIQFNGSGAAEVQIYTERKAVF